MTEMELMGCHYNLFPTIDGDEKNFWGGVYLAVAQGFFARLPFDPPASSPFPCDRETKREKDISWLCRVLDIRDRIKTHAVIPTKRVYPLIRLREGVHKRLRPRLVTASHTVNSVDDGFPRDSA